MNEENTKPVEKKLIHIPKSIAMLFLAISLIGVSIFSTLIYSVIDAFIAIDPDNLNQSLWIQAIYNCGSLIIFIIIIPLVLGSLKTKEILSQFKNKQNLIDGLKYGGLMFLASFAYSFLISFFPIDTNNNQNVIIDMTAVAPVLVVLLSCVLAPITEEVAFRLSLFGTLHKVNRYLAYAICIIVFSLIHSSFFREGMTSADYINELVSLPAYAIGAFFLCRAYEKNGSIATSMVAHSLYNAISMIQIFIVLGGR